MAKWQNDDMLDQALAYLYLAVTTGAYTNVKLAVCSAQPSNHTEATVTNMLALITLTPGSDFALAAGDTSGRKVTVAEKTGTVTNSGTATHVALVADINAVSTLTYVTTCTSQSLTATNAITVPAFDIEFRDPA